MSLPSLSPASNNPTSSPLRLPHPFSQIPRYPLLFPCPSPIHALPALSAAVSSPNNHPSFSSTTTTLHSISLFAKREDTNSPLAGGGNKTRKLEYLVPDAIHQGADTLVSVGGIQSNHTRQVVAVARKLGWQAKVLQEHWVPGDDAVFYERAGNLQLSRVMGAGIEVGPPVRSGEKGKAGGEVGEGVGEKGRKGDEAGSENQFSHQEDKVRLANLMQSVTSAGGRPYLVPAGASAHPLGGLGFARWAFEVAEQESDMGIFFDVVIVCAVTGSTMGGMIAGFKLLEQQPDQAGKPQRRIVGIDASARPVETKATVLKIARDTGTLIGLGEDVIKEKDVELDARYHAGTYGVPDEQTIKAIREGAEMEAFITDPVYEGKVLAGMLDMARKGEFGNGKNVLFAHLGGQLALNSYSDIF